MDYNTNSWTKARRDIRRSRLRRRVCYTMAIIAQEQPLTQEEPLIYKSYQDPPKDSALSQTSLWWTDNE